MITDGVGHPAPSNPLGVKGDGGGELFRRWVTWVYMALLASAVVTGAATPAGTAPDRQLTLVAR